jgi:hypothetical protein
VLDAAGAVEDREPRVRLLEQREGLGGAAPSLSGPVPVRELRPQEVKNCSIALVEVASSRAVEEEDLRMRERSVEPDGHLVLGAQRVKPVPIDIRSAELGPGEEIGDLQGAEVTRHLVAAAGGMLVPHVPVGRLLRSVDDLDRKFLRPENDLPDAVELVIDNLIAGDEARERLEQRPRERLKPVDRARLAEELDHGL